MVRALGDAGISDARGVPEGATSQGIGADAALGVVMTNNLLASDYMTGKGYESVGFSGVGPAGEG